MPATAGTRVHQRVATRASIAGDLMKMRSEDDRSRVHANLAGRHVLRHRRSSVPSGVHLMCRSAHHPAIQVSVEYTRRKVRWTARLLPRAQSQGRACTRALLRSDAEWRAAATRLHLAMSQTISNAKVGGISSAVVCKNFTTGRSHSLRRRVSRACAPRKRIGLQRHI